MTTIIKGSSNLDSDDVKDSLEKYMIVASNYTTVGDEGDFTVITDANLPDNITNGTRYVLTNPFGSDVPCEVIVQIYTNSIWTTLGQSAASATGTFYFGALAGYVPNVGIVIQTAENALISNTSSLVGLNLAGGSSTGETTSAPCRLLVKRF